MYARRASRYTGASLVDRRMCTMPVRRATVPSGKKFRFAPASPKGGEMPEENSAGGSTHSSR
jgi:hypothetical protein